MSDEWQVPKGYGGDAHQWGMAVPPGYEPVYLVPRPPRPGVVNLAVALTYAGVAVSGIGAAVGVVGSLQAQDTVSRMTSTTGGQATEPVLRTALGLGIGFAVLLWLAPAVGAVICALLTRRGANPARIVLASLMGLFALFNLCYGVLRGIAGGVSGPQVQTEAPALNWIGLAVDVVDLGLAVTIGVLLLVPLANRYFSPGPGRRFVNGTAQVPSTYDPP